MSIDSTTSTSPKLRIATHFQHLQHQHSSVRSHLLSTITQIDHTIQLMRKFRSPQEILPDTVRFERDSLYADGELFCRTNPILEPPLHPRPRPRFHPLPFPTTQHRNGSLLCTLIYSELMPGQITLIRPNQIRDFFVIAGDGFLRMFNWSSGKCVVDWVVTVRSSSNCITALTGTDKMLIFASQDGFIRFFDVKLGSIVEEFPAHEFQITFLEMITVANVCLVSGSDDGKVRLWREETLELMYEVMIPSGKIGCCEIHWGEEGEELELVIVMEDLKRFRWKPIQGRMDLEEAKFVVGGRERDGEEVVIGRKFVVEKEGRRAVVRSGVNEKDCVELKLGEAVMGNVVCDYDRDLIGMSLNDRFVMWKVIIDGDVQ